MWIPWPPPAVVVVATAPGVVVATAPDDSASVSPSAPPEGSRTRRPSESSMYLRCHQSSRAWTRGISAKLYSGGGDGIDHSSDRPSHGSPPAIGPRLAV